MLFRSKVDRWLPALLLCSTAVPVAALGIAAVRGEVHPALAVGILLMIAPGSALTFWIYRHTAYDVTETDLIVGCGPFQSRIPLGSITSVAPTRSLLAAPALSRERLEIRYGAANRVIVSPADRVGFLRALCQGGARGVVGA